MDHSSKFNDTIHQIIFLFDQKHSFLFNTECHWPQQNAEFWGRLAGRVNEFVVCVHSMSLMEAHLTGPPHSFKPALRACFRKRFFSRLVASPPPPIVPCPLGALLALSDANSASHFSCPLSERLLYGGVILSAVSSLYQPHPDPVGSGGPHQSHTHERGSAYTQSSRGIPHRDRQIPSEVEEYIKSSSCVFGRFHDVDQMCIRSERVILISLEFQYRCLNKHCCVFCFVFIRGNCLPPLFLLFLCPIPVWMNGGLFLLAGADGRDWVWVTGEAVQLLPAVRLQLCVSASARRTCARSQTVTVTHAVTLTQKHEYMNALPHGHSPRTISSAPALY